MADAGKESPQDWGRFWLETYKGLGGLKENCGSKGCPRAAAYGLWRLGRIKGSGMPLKLWTVPKVNQDLGKNAAYAVIATELLSTNDMSIVELWPLVKERYERDTGEIPAKSEQGEIKIVVALFREGALKTDSSLAS
jgi:hypothetical protein